jgi:hypothetical protein
MRAGLPSALGLIAACVIACGPESGVGQNGQYVFIADAPVVDTTPYPLLHLLELEQDDERGEALVYAFSGELGEAGLGLPDLRRLARGFNAFQMAFDAPRSRYTRPQLLGAPEVALRLSDGRESRLRALDAEGLRRSGASRFLSSVDSDDYDVRAWFGVLGYEGELPDLSVAFAQDSVELPAALTAPELAVEFTADTFTVQYGELGADYLVIELLQVVHSKEDPNEPIEALVRTSARPGTPYVVGRALLDSAAGQGCWSTQRPLRVRVTQVRREYVADTRGDRATIHRRSTARDIDPKRWTPLLSAVQPAPYCELYH